MINSTHFQRTHDFMHAVKTVCADRKLPMPDIREVILTWRNERVYAFAVFPPAIDHKQEAYADDHFLPQLSSALQGIPVTYSNSTGFRLVALLDGQHDRLPLRVDYLDHLPGHICLGCGAAGRELALT